MEIIGIHNNIDPKPPMYVRVPTPKNFKSKYEEDKYWDREFKKWHDGYSGLTGMHYMYLQEMEIADEHGAAIRPHWRDCDNELFEGWDWSTRNQHDQMVIKRREIGLSTFGGGVVPLYTALTRPGSDSVMTSASKTRLQSMFRKKTEFIYDRLNPYYREEKARKSQSGQLFIAKEDKITKTFSGLQSSIYSIDTTKDKFGFESFRASYIFLDELFLHTHGADVKASANSSRMKGLKRVAPILLGGTCGDMSNKGAKEGLKIYNSSKASKTLVTFLGGTKGLEEFSVNGWCDEKAAEEFILKSREELSKSEDKTEYFKFLTSYPLSIEEVFNLVTDCALPQSVQITLNEAERKIDTEGIKQAKYHLVNTGSSVVANPDDIKGKVTIIKPPIKGHEYIAGTDPIPFGNNQLGEGSEYSIIIFDNTTKEFVADYTDRGELNDMDMVNNSILLQRLYYNALTMLELNRGEVVLKDYLALGAQNLLAPMPTNLGIVWEERKYPWGYYMSGGAGNQINARCETYSLKFLLAHGYNVRHRRLIHEFRRLSTDANCDVLSAAKGALLYAAELEELKKKHTYKPTVVRTLRGQWANGVFKQVVVESTINR